MVVPISFALNADKASMPYTLPRRLVAAVTKLLAGSSSCTRLAVQSLLKPHAQSRPESSLYAGAQLESPCRRPDSASP